MKIIEMRMHPVLNKNLFPVNYHMYEGQVYINEAYIVLKKSMMEHGYRRVNIWVRGSSGSILGSMLWLLLVHDTHVTDTSFHYVRKDNDDCNTYIGVKKNLVLLGTDVANIVLDDFSCSGHTVMEIVNNSGIDCFQYLILMNCDADIIRQFREENKTLKYLITRNGQHEEFKNYLQEGYEGRIEYDYKPLEMNDLLAQFPEEKERNCTMKVL